MYILGYIYYSSRRPLAALRNWRAHRAAILEIEALPDRLLRDIGMNRGDIDATVTAVMGGRDAQATASSGIAGAPAVSLEAACY